MKELSLFVVSDLHLSFGTDKPMDIFGGWQDYTRRIAENWSSIVTDNDTVVLGGDLSWATKLDDSKVDFEYIHSLPGQKIILKGNHDYWWSTVKKMSEFFEKNGFDDIKILYNNAFEVGKIAVCGTRGWMFEDTQQDEKIKQREAGRFLRSAEEAVKTGLEPVAFLHYPPVFGDEISENMLEVLHRFNIKRCYYGHLHGAASAQKALNGEFEGIKFRLTSCDTVGFCPVLVEKF